MIRMKNVLPSLALLAALFLSPESFGQAPGSGSDGKVVKLDGSFLEPLQKRDSVLIGDQFRYGFHLKDVAEGTVFALPDFSKGFMDSVEIVRPFVADTVKVHDRRNEPKSYDIDISMVITSFEEGRHELIPLALVKEAGGGRMDTLVFNPQVLEVRTMPVDTTTYKIHDIKGQIRYPVTLAELLPYVAGIWLAAALAILVWALVAAKRRRSEGGAAHKDPPYIVALRKLEHFRGSKFWVPEKQKVYYSGITDTLREYIAARFGIDAMEMTTAEIFKDLRHSDVPADLYEEVKTLFETADFVKFAKAFATDDENAAALPAAVRFVTVTYQSQLAEEESKRKADEAKSAEAKSAGVKKEGGEA